MTVRTQNKYRINQVVEDALILWAQNELGPTIPVIWDKQDDYRSTNGKRPHLPFVTFNIISGPARVGGEIGAASRVHSGTDTWTMKFRKKFVLTINVYAENAHLETAQKLFDSLYKDTVLQTLRNAGVAIWTITDPTDISALLETGHELRATFDVTVSFAYEVIDAPVEIRKVKISKTNDPKFDRLIIS